MYVQIITTINIFGLAFSLTRSHHVLNKTLQDHLKRRSKQRSRATWLAAKHGHMTRHTGVGSIKHRHILGDIIIAGGSIFRVGEEALS